MESSADGISARTNADRFGRATELELAPPAETRRRRCRILRSRTAFAMAGLQLVAMRDALRHVRAPLARWADRHAKRRPLKHLATLVVAQSRRREIPRKSGSGSRLTTSATSTFDICELRLADGKLIMFLAIDRVSKFTYVEFHEHRRQDERRRLPEERRRSLPLQDPHGADRQRHGLRRSAQEQDRGRRRRFLGAHIFDRVCTRERHRAPADQALSPLDQRPGRANEPHVKDATVKVFHYDDLESLKAHVLAFVTAYNFAKHLKALRWRTPFQAICDAWTKTPHLQHQPAPPHPGTTHLVRRARDGRHSASAGRSRRRPPLLPHTGWRAGSADRAPSLIPLSSLIPSQRPTAVAQTR